MEVKFVKQEDRCGCAVASMAMALGKTYGEVKKDFCNDFIDEGIKTADIIEYLGNSGCSIVYKKIECWNHIDFARKEMLKPFAPVHIVCIQWKYDSNHHAVVMTDKGKILCPCETPAKGVKEAYSILEVIGVYPS